MGLATLIASSGFSVDKCKSALIGNSCVKVEKAFDFLYSFMIGTEIDIEDFGYESQEYFFSGEANSYKNLGELKPDGVWNVAANKRAPYKTRLMIYRPKNPKDFNGTVLVEWLNVTAGLDTAPDWIFLHTEIMRRGYAWVGVSAQALGVRGGEPGLDPVAGFVVDLKFVNPFRYWSLSHPGDSYSYDIYAQAARAIKGPRAGIDPMASYDVKRLIALGESQSATRLMTFINSFEPNIDLFDGYYIHSRLGYIPDFGGASAPLSQKPEQAILTPKVVKFRTDVNKPIMNLQAETDVIKLGAIHSRQEDHEYFRLWEVAGTAHADYYLLNYGRYDEENVASAQLFVTDAPNFYLSCPDPVNSAPQHHFVGKAALKALDDWIRLERIPPSFPRLETNAEGTEFLRDQFGNTLGGVRSPYMDVPIAQLLGDNEQTKEDGNICFLAGKTIPFSKDTLKKLYPSKESYLKSVRQAIYQGVKGGYLLLEDVGLIEGAAIDNELFE